MGYVWVPANAWAVGIGLLIMAAAAAIYFFAPHRTVNRRLGLMLLAQGFGFVAAWGLANMTTHPGHAHAWSVLGYVGYATLVPLYLLFVSQLRSPLASILSGRVATTVLWAGVVLVAILVVVRSDWFTSDLRVLPDGRWHESYGSLGPVLPLLHGILPLYGLLIAWDQWRRSKGDPLLRRQSTAYLLAFGWRDLNWAFVLLVLLPLMGTYEVGQTPPWIIALMGLTELVFVGILAYAVLAAQLFDIDLKIKIALERSTVVAVIAAAAFVASELIEQAVGIDQLVPAILVAALITLGIRPLQNWAARFADTAMPHVQNTDEYRLVRKREVYRAAASSAMHDGRVTAHERSVLETLARELGLTKDDATELERDATGGLP